MALDPNIPLQIQPPTNPLQQIGGLVNLQGNILQQKAMSQQIRANQAISRAYQQATDPTTGRVDQNQLLAAISQDPDAAYNMPQVQGQIAEQRNKQLEYDTKQYDLSSKMNAAHGQIGALLANPNLGKGDMTGDIYKSIIDTYKTGLVGNDPQKLQEMLNQVPTDPAAQRLWIQQKYLASQNALPQAMQLLQPNVTNVNTGGAQHLVNTNPLAGSGMRELGAYRNELTPGEASTPTQIGTTPGGQAIMGTRQQFANQTQPAPPAARNGRYPQPGNQGAPGADDNPGGVVIGLPAGAAAAADVAGQASAKAAQDLASQAETSPQRVYFLSEMRNQLGNFNPGPGADWTNKAKALALQLGPGAAQKFGVDPSSVASKEEFTKFSTQLAMQQAGTLGSGTDSKLATALTGNPNASLSKLGNQQIIQAMIGMEKANQAKNMAWQQSGAAPQDYQKWSAQWNAQMDPRVFVADQMSDQQLQAMYKKMSPREQRQFSQSWAAAEQMGVLEH